MPTITKLYTLQEASAHKTRDDCWVVIDGKVYDVTKYLDDHPGGDDVLLSVTGKDAVEEFEDAGHSKSARELMQDYFIGEVEEPSPNIIEELEIFTKEQPSFFSYEFLNKSMQFWALPASVLGISVVAGLLYLRKK